mgnify:CR=1 FL=1|tara:strand:+ start:202 stop:375 length:174 start_codon:yes stop_codon:yes gene_type:complete
MDKIDIDIIHVPSKIETICCDGGEDELGHPAVYFTFDKKEKIICNYCGKTFIKEKES